MHIYKYFLFLLPITFISCRVVTPPTQEMDLERSSLPATWTLPPSTPTSIPSPVPPTHTSTPLPSITPYPPGYLESAWMIRVNLPSGWDTPEWMVELSDHTIMATGTIYSRGYENSIWIAHLTAQGEILWIKTFIMDENEEFIVRGLKVGANGVGLLSGSYIRRSDAGYSYQKVTLAISSDGQILWQKPFGSEYVEVLPNQSFLLRSGFGAEEVDIDGDPIWMALLDFGEEISNEYPELYPSLDVELVHHLADGGLIFYGTIYDIYWIPVPSDSHRSGMMEGEVAYWYAGFAPDGSLVWKHFYELDTGKQWIGNAVITSDGYLAITGADDYGTQSYAWVRKVDQAGQTVFYKRYLEMPGGKVTSTLDGGLLLTGARVIPRVSQNNIYQYKLMKVNAAGEVDWARQFTDNFKIRDVLQLSDGSFLLAADYSIEDTNEKFVRLDQKGQLLECPGIIIGDLVTLVDQGLPIYDKASEMPINLEYLTPGEREKETPPALSLKSVDVEVIELCRNLGD